MNFIEIESSCNIKVTVLKDNQITLEDQVFCDDLDRDLRLKCEVEGNPKPDIFDKI